MDDELGDRKPCVDGQGRRALAVALVQLVVFCTVGLLIFFMTGGDSQTYDRGHLVEAQCSILTYYVTNTTCESCESPMELTAVSPIEHGPRGVAMFENMFRWEPWWLRSDPTAKQCTQRTPVLPLRRDTSGTTCANSLDWVCFRVTLTVSIGQKWKPLKMVNMSSEISKDDAYTLVWPAYTSEQLEEYGRCATCLCDPDVLVEQIHTMINRNSTFLCYYNQDAPATTLTLTAVPPLNVSSLHIITLIVLVLVVIILGVSVSCMICLSRHAVRCCGLTLFPRLESPDDPETGNKAENFELQPVLPPKEVPALGYGAITWAALRVSTEEVAPSLGGADAPSPTPSEGRSGRTTPRTMGAESSQSPGAGIMSSPPKPPARGLPRPPKPAVLRPERSASPKHRRALSL